MGSDKFIDSLYIKSAAIDYKHHRDTKEASNYIKLMKALYPYGNYPDTDDDDNFSDIVNGRIEEVLKKLIGSDYSDTIDLDKFIRWFGEGIWLDPDQKLVSDVGRTIERICQHKDEFRSNIERLYG